MNKNGTKKKKKKKKNDNLKSIFVSSKYNPSGRDAELVPKVLTCLIFDHILESFT